MQDIQKLTTETFVSMQSVYVFYQGSIGKWVEEEF